MTKVFVSGLAYATTEETVRKAFEKHGAVADVAIVTDRDTGRSRGFGFVTFDSEDEVSNAVQKLDGTEIDWVKVGVKLASDGTTRRKRGPIE